MVVSFILYLSLYYMIKIGKDNQEFKKAQLRNK